MREFSYYFGGSRIVPMQPFSGVAKWDGDKLTFWGHGQDIYPSREFLAGWLGIDKNNIHFINKWNGGTFGGFGVRTAPFWGLVAHISKVTGRPVKAMLTKAEELYHILHKPETMSKFKVGLTKEGKIHALRYELHMVAGLTDTLPPHVAAEVSKNQLELYTARTPHWEQVSYAYKSNTPMVGCNRSCTQQEVKWAFENLADELAELAGLDPVQFRLLNVAQPGDRLDPATDWHTEMKKPEVENGALTYDCFASVEVLEEGAKLFGWDKRNPKPGSAPGRFKRGMGLGISQHHPGSLSYHEGEPAFKTERGILWSADVEMDPTGRVILRSALPDSGTNHDTGMAILIAEMLGISSIDSIKLMWGDSDTAPPTDQWAAGRTCTVQGGAALVAAKKLRAELLKRAAAKLGVDAALLDLRDSVVRVKADPSKSIAAAELLGGASLRMHGEVRAVQGRSMAKGVGACFVEVEVDTWTGQFKITRVVYSHDTGKVINPFVAVSDMEGSFMQSFQVATNSIPYDKEFPGQMHNSIAFLSFPIPTIMEFPEEIDPGLHREPRAALVLRLQGLQRDQHRLGAGRHRQRHLQRHRGAHQPSDQRRADPHGPEKTRGSLMKPVTLYKPASVKEATQILAHHGPEAAVYAGGTDLLVRLKNRLTASPKYLVDIKQIGELNFIRETPDGGIAIGAITTIARDRAVRAGGAQISAAAADLEADLLARIAQPVHHRGRHHAGGVVPVSARQLSVLAQRRLHLLRRDRRQQLLPQRDGRPAVLCGLSRRCRHRARGARCRRQGGGALGRARDVARGAHSGRRDGGRQGCSRTCCIRTRSSPRS